MTGDMWCEPTSSCFDIALLNYAGNRYHLRAGGCCDHDQMGTRQTRQLPQAVWRSVPTEEGHLPWNLIEDGLRCRNNPSPEYMFVYNRLLHQISPLVLTGINHVVTSV